MNDRMGNPERGGDHRMQTNVRDRAHHMPKVQLWTEEQARPVPERDFQTRWGSLALLALLLFGREVF
jgi:hypothetical protein